jgi:hypothetical protein
VHYAEIWSLDAALHEVIDSLGSDRPLALLSPFSFSRVGRMYGGPRQYYLMIVFTPQKKSDDFFYF